MSSTNPMDVFISDEMQSRERFLNSLAKVLLNLVRSHMLVLHDAVNQRLYNN